MYKYGTNVVEYNNTRIWNIGDSLHYHIFNLSILFYSHTRWAPAVVVVQSSSIYICLIIYEYDTVQAGYFRIVMKTFKILSLFFLIYSNLITMCSAKGRDAKTHVRLHWLFLHYHKTGAFLSEAIAKSVSVDKFTYKSDNSKRIGFNTLNTANVIHSHAGNLLFNWSTSLITPKYQYRVIHFVRDPYDMTLSAFLYHSQHPAPERK